MSKNTALLLILVFLLASLVIVTKPVFSSANITENTWVSKKPMHEARAHLGVAVVNNKIFAIGGDSWTFYGYTGDIFNSGAVHTGTINVVDTNEEYDPDMNTWTFKSSIPTPRCSFGIAVYQNKIYCIGGYTPHGYTGVNEVYDPLTDKWETRKSMPTARGRLQANVANGKIYLIGGETDRFTDSNVNEVYDPTFDSWTTKAPSPYNITSGASVAVDDKIYFLATAPSLSSGVLIQIYNTMNDSWSFGASAPSDGTFAGAGVTTGVNAPKRIYFFDESSTSIYNPANDSWTTGVSMPTSRGCVGVAVINDVFYTVGGVGSQIFSALYTRSLFGGISPRNTNEQYIPFGYEVEPQQPVEPQESDSGSPLPVEYIYAGAIVAIILSLFAVLFLPKKRKKAVE